MTRPLLIAALLALIGSWLWWRQAPQRVAPVDTNSAFTSVEPCPVGYWARFDGAVYVCWKEFEPQGPCPPGQSWQTVNWTDGGSGSVCMEPWEPKR